MVFGDVSITSVWFTTYGVSSNKICELLTNSATFGDAGTSIIMLNVVTRPPALHRQPGSKYVVSALVIVVNLLFLLRRSLPEGDPAKRRYYHLFN